MEWKEDSKSKIVSELVEVFKLHILAMLRAEPNETKRFLKFVAWLNRELEARGLGRIIVTGGFAVEVYTGRVYRTMDVDIVVDGGGHSIVEDFLRIVGERIGRGYALSYEDLVLKSIDIVATVYDREIEPVKLLIDDGYVYLDPPEVLIVTYLAGWKFWGSTEDRDKAIWLLAATMDLVDMGKLRDLATRRSVLDKLDEVYRLVSEAMSRS